MAGEPILGKEYDQPGRAKRPVTWGMLRKLRAWAQKTADAFGYPVYLVGSVLSKSCPRDVDVAIIIPVAEFERRFGPIPQQPGSPEMSEYMHNIFQPIIWHYFDAQETVQWKKRIDVRLTPDTWWPEKDRMLLAEPRDAR